MSDRKPEELISDIISFINKERELYGDFVYHNQNQKSFSESKNEKTSPNANIVTEPSIDTDSTTPTSSTDQSFDSQEGLFNQNKSEKIYHEIDKCETLEELETLCRGADVLKTDLENTKLVFGVGNPNADLILIGEAPGAEEDKKGEPFVGKAGQLLNKILDAINFSRDDVYITNILKHRPPNNRNPNPEERERSLPFLVRQIDLIEPKLILSLGKVSAQTLLDKNTSLSKMRGKFHNFRGQYELLATYHPAALLRHAKWKRPTWEDMKLLRNRYDELGGLP